MANIHLIFGEEIFLKDRLLKNLTKTSGVDPKDDFSFTKIDLKEVNEATLESVLLTPSLLGGARLVFCYDAHQAKAQLLKGFEKLLDKLNDPDLTLIIEGVKFDKRTSLYKKLNSVGQIHELKPLYENQVGEYLNEIAKEFRVKLDPKASSLLVDLFGSDLSQLASELEKLSLFVFPKQVIELGDVVQLCGTGVLKNVFDLTKFLGERNLKEAQRVFAKSVQQGESAIRLVGLCRNHFRKLLLVKDNQKSSLSKEQLAKLIGVPPFFVKDYQEQVKSFSEKQLSKVYRKISDLNFSLRDSRIAAPLLFESFIQETCLH